jgi:hypothetical protein
VFRQLGNVEIGIEHEHSRSHCVNDACGAKHAVRVALEVSGGESFDNPINFLRLCLEVKLSAQVSESIDQVLAVHLEVLHIETESHLIDWPSGYQR